MLKIIAAHAAALTLALAPAAAAEASTGGDGSGPACNTFRPAVAEICRQNRPTHHWEFIGHYDGMTHCFALGGDTAIFSCREGYETS